MGILTGRSTVTRQRKWGIWGSRIKRELKGLRGWYPVRTKEMRPLGVLFDHSSLRPQVIENSFRTLHIRCHLVMNSCEMRLDVIDCSPL